MAARPTPPAHVTYERTNLLVDSDEAIRPSGIRLHRTKIDALEHAVREQQGYAPWLPGQSLHDAITAFEGATLTTAPEPKPRTRRKPEPVTDTDDGA